MAAGDHLADVTPLRPDPAPVHGSAVADVGRRVVDLLEDLLPQMGEAYRREVAEYAAMTDEQFDHVLQTSGAFVGAFVRALGEGVDRPVPDHARLVAAGRRRQEAGISLDAAMHAFRIASRVGWTAIADASTAIDPLLVSELAGRWIEYVDRAATAFAEGHTTAASEQLRRVDARRRALVADLLASDDEATARAVGARHGLRLADRYVPVLLATAEPFNLESRLEPLLPSSTLFGQRADHLLVLVPAAEVAEDRVRLEALATDGAVVHGRPARLGAPLVSAVAEVESVLAAAITTGATGLLEPDALVLERLVQEHDGLQRHLDEHVLEPLVAADPEGIFRETLHAYLDDGAVRAVADRLFVHANTVTYRLRRVRELTGLDARVPRQAALLVLALAREATTATTDPEETT